LLGVWKMVVAYFNVLSLKILKKWQKLENTESTPSFDRDSNLEQSNSRSLHKQDPSSIQWRYSPNRVLTSSKDSLPRHLLRSRNNEVLQCEVVSLTTNPR
jgi:hypothetical protein